MFKFERRWATVVLGSFLPDAPSPLRSAWEEHAEPAQALEDMRADATPLAALGMRLALWLVVWSPLWMFRSLRPLPSLPAPERSVVLGELLEHRLMAVRELTLFLKLAASFTLFRSDDARAASHYDGISP